MKMLLAGSWCWAFYERACADSLREIGMDVVEFTWAPYFDGLFGRVQGNLPYAGPAVLRLNKDLLVSVENLRPDIVFVWRGTHILPRTLKKIKKDAGTLLVSYCNDDPFPGVGKAYMPWHYKYYWHNFLSCLPYYDINFAYRSINVPEFYAYGAKRVKVLKPYFIPSINRPIILTESEREAYDCDVAFIGHFERDGRQYHLQALTNAGLKVRVYGNGWPDDVIKGIDPAMPLARSVLGDEYAKAVCGAKICLSFLSKLNRDTYTRRSFEIPACGRPMLSERTDDLLEIFEEDKEAAYFSSTDELVSKAVYLVRDSQKREAMARAGFDRCLRDGHDVKSRMEQMMLMINESREKGENACW